MVWKKAPAKESGFNRNLALDGLAKAACDDYHQLINTFRPTGWDRYGAGLENALASHEKRRLEVTRYHLDEVEYGVSVLVNSHTTN